MNNITEYNIMQSLTQDRVTTYEDNVETLLNRIIALESKIKELEQKIEDSNHIEYY